MTEIKFTETEVPTIERAGRPKEPNPYQPLAERLSKNVRTKDSDGVAVKFEAPKHEKGDEAAVAYALRKIREAGDEYKITVRSTNEGRKVTVWAVPKITRQRRDKSDA